MDVLFFAYFGSSALAGRRDRAHEVFEGAAEEGGVIKTALLRGGSDAAAFAQKQQGALTAVAIEVGDDGTAGELFEAAAEGVFIDVNFSSETVEGEFLRIVFADEADDVLDLLMTSAAGRCCGERCGMVLSKLDEDMNDQRVQLCDAAGKIGREVGRRELREQVEQMWRKDGE